jgi:hypothetical protein
MAKLYDELVSFRRGSDTGDNDANSVQPLSNTEAVWADNDNRPIDNLRVRTETLRQGLETANYFADYDRALLLRADAALTFSEPTAGAYELTLASAGSLWVYPALSPGRQSGGRWQGGRVFCANPSAAGAWTAYSGTPAVDDLILTTHRQYTGQRGYADADNFTTTPGGRTTGANRTVVTLIADPAVAGGVPGITAVIEGEPRVRIRITYGTAGTPTTLADLISYINNDRTSQGAYGVADFLRASSTGVTTNAPIPFTNGVVQGAYDAEAHEVTKAQFDAFFAAVDGGGAQINRLAEGEGLAVGYPQGPVNRAGVTPQGGRRQSIWDYPTDRAGAFSQNTTPAAGWALFVTGREPEKIPGAVPIGKVIGGEFVFIDGTRVAPGETLQLGESRTTYAALRSTTLLADGASLVGYEGGAPWSADGIPPSVPTLPADDVSDTLTRIATHLTLTTTSEAGTRRIGGEAQLGGASLGNDYFLSLTAGSVREQLVQLLQGYDGGSRLVGINGRVSEWGHQMQGARPLRKDFGATGMPAAGAEFLRATLHAPTNLLAAAPDAPREKALMVLQPLVYNVNANDNLVAAEAGVVASATVITVTSMTLTRFGNVSAKLPLVYDTPNSAPVPLVYAALSNTSGAADAPEGLYVVQGVDTATGNVVFRKIDGTSPNFTGAVGTIGIRFYAAFEVGADHRASRLRWAHVGVDAPTFAAAGAPAAVLGSSSVDAPLFKVFTPDSVGAGVLQSVIWPNRMEWAGGRKTTNLLLDADKNYLDGQEDHLTVDATPNHHHGANYTRLVWHAPLSIVTTDNNTDIGTYPLGALAGRACTANPANTARIGVILDVSVKARSAAAIAAGDALTLRVAFWALASGAGQPHAVVEVNMQMHAAPGVATTQVTRQQIFVPTVFVPTDLSGGIDRFHFSVTNRAGLDGGANAEVISINEVGGLFIQTDAVV